jgi:hypothetical protein
MKAACAVSAAANQPAARIAMATSSASIKGGGVPRQMPKCCRTVAKSWMTGTSRTPSGHDDLVVFGPVSVCPSTSQSDLKGTRRSGHSRRIIANDIPERHARPPTRSDSIGGSSRASTNWCPFARVAPLMTRFNDHAASNGAMPHKDVHATTKNRGRMGVSVHA